MAIDFNDVMMNPEEGIPFILASGAPGATPAISIGEVTTGAYNEPAEVTMSGTVTNPRFNFKIPAGVPGNSSINDDAGQGDNDYVWSADKSFTETKDVSDSLLEVAGKLPIHLIDGKYINLSGASVVMTNGQPTITGNSSNGYAVGFMPCAEGDVFKIFGHGGSSTRLWAFVDISGTILDVAEASAYASGITLTAPANSAFIIVHTNGGEISIKTNKDITSLLNMFDCNTVDVLAALSRKSETKTGITFTWQNNACLVNGKATAGTANYFQDYRATNPLIESGKKLFVHFEQGSGGNVALFFSWHFSNGYKNSYYYEDSEIIVPENAIGASIGLYVKNGDTIDNETVEVNLFTVTGGVQSLDNKIAELEETFVDFLPKNILKDFGDFSDTTISRVTYTWNVNHEDCVVNGTASPSTSYDFLWRYDHGFPPQITPGSQYQLRLSASEDDKVGVRVYFLDMDGETVTSQIYYGDALISIPETSIGITIRLEVSNGITVDNVAVNVKLMTVGTLEISGGVANHTAKMFSVGSSFMTGLTHVSGGSALHYCSYDSTPYGNIAISLGIESKNVQHILLGSTGILHDAGEGSILEKLLDTDLSPYDYVLTEVNRPDINEFNLGTLESEASQTTIVGAVKTLIAYMKTQNPNATLIIVGPPPSDQNPSKSYQYVFTANYAMGYSIGDTDIMMHRLAVQEHFIYIDWEDLNFSYYFPDLCDDGNVHPRDEKTNRSMGLYLARQCNYTTSIVKVLKADLQE